MSKVEENKVEVDKIIQSDEFHNGLCKAFETMNGKMNNTQKQGEELVEKMKNLSEKMKQRSEGVKNFLNPKEVNSGD